MTIDWSQIVQQAIGAGLVVGPGWWVTYLLTTRAQRKNLKNQVMDRARLEITTGIRKCQASMQSVLSSINQLETRLNGSLEYFDLWASSCVHSIDLFIRDFGREKGWVVALEDYESLFGSTRRVRVQLARRQEALQNELAHMYLALVQHDHCDAGQRAAERQALLEILRWNAGTIAALGDQARLLEDLRDQLQREALRDVVRQPAVLRPPPEADSPQIVDGGRGMLELVRDSWTPKITAIVPEPDAEKRRILDGRG